MAIAGFCRGCQQHVWLNDQWGCVNGHAWDQISNWYDPQTGEAVIPYWLQPAQPTAGQAVEAQPQPAVEPVAAPAPAPEPVAAPAPAPEPVAAPAPAPASAPDPVRAQAPAVGSRLAMLADVLELLGQYPNYRAQYGTDTDIVIDNQVSSAAWSGGKKSVEYSAVLKAVEPERTVYFWELLKERGSGISFGGFEAESYSTFGTKRSGTTKGATVGPSGVVESHTWDYGATRQIIESVAARHGWAVKTVLKRKSASW
jgi:hypothetical protein